MECHWLHNYLLGLKNEGYDKYKIILGREDLQPLLKGFSTSFISFDVKKEVMRMINANFSSYFTLKRNGYTKARRPKFHGIDYFFTLSFVQDFMINGDQLIISTKDPKNKKLTFKLPYTHPIKGMKCERHKTKTSEIKVLKISIDGDGEFYVSISYEKREPEIDSNNKDNIYIDLGKVNLVTSFEPIPNEANIYNSKFLTQNQKYNDSRTDQLKSKRDKKVKYSLKWRKYNTKIKKLNSKKKTQTKLSLHKLSKDLTSQNKNLTIGDLNGLKENIITPFKKLNHQMQNNWPLKTFVGLLEYKSKLKGIELIKVNEAWTSKTCCSCGCLNDKLKVSDRVYVCKNCGSIIDRDVNGAVNIYKVCTGSYNLPLDTLKVSKRSGWGYVHKQFHQHSLE